jgi:hypothetical protein
MMDGMAAMDHGGAAHADPNTKTLESGAKGAWSGLSTSRAHMNSLASFPAITRPA